jgi:hypothetical protein
MAAYVEHEFERGFVVDEERLRKLNHIIAERIDPSKAGGKFHYRVYRGDAFAYTTHSIDDVLKEDNSDWRRLTKLEIETQDGADPYLLLSFASDGVRLEIHGGDRDTIFVLFSDLREYMTEEVTTAIPHVREFTQVIASVLVVAFMVWFTVYLTVRSRDNGMAISDLSAAIRAHDDTTKLNYLVRAVAASNRQPRPPIAALATGVLILLILLVDAPERLLRFASPSNVFLFGAQKTRYDRRRRILSNLFWIVVIGGGVSLIAGIVASRVMKGH